MAPRFTLFAASLALIALTPRAASAYCRESTCNPSGARCTPAGAADCGVTLSWQRTCLGFATQQDGSATVTAATARGILVKAFAAWEAVDCGDGPAGVKVIDTGLVPCGAAEYNDHAGNVNVLVFRDKNWPHPEGTDNIALTTVTYDLGTGQIFDADIEVNTAQYHLTTGDLKPDYDLLAVLTHEAGHFLGLAHSPEPTATMFASYMPGDLGDRTLAQDDMAGLCDAFPPDPGLAAACNPIPRHGFSADCAVEQKPVSCAASAPLPDGPPASPVPFALALGLVAARRFARRRDPHKA